MPQISTLRRWYSRRSASRRVRRTPFHLSCLCAYGVCATITAFRALVRCKPRPADRFLCRPPPQSSPHAPQIHPTSLNSGFTGAYEPQLSGGTCFVAGHRVLLARDDGYRRRGTDVHRSFILTPHSLSRVRTLPQPSTELGETSAASCARARHGPGVSRRARPDDPPQPPSPLPSRVPAARPFYYNMRLYATPQPLTKTAACRNRARCTSTRSPEPSRGPPPNPTQLPPLPSEPARIRHTGRTRGYELHASVHVQIQRGRRTHLAVFYIAAARRLTGSPASSMHHTAAKPTHTECTGSTA